jgi:hypothetical protein
VAHQIKAKMQVYANKPGSLDTDGKKMSEQVSLSAVYSADPESENYSFSKATPGAYLNMTISNPEAFDYFEEGKEYIVTFEKVEKAS